MAYSGAASTGGRTPEQGARNVIPGPRMIRLPARQEDAERLLDGLAH
jgi:hypothetical protein